MYCTTQVYLPKEDAGQAICALAIVTFPHLQRAFRNDAYSVKRKAQQQAALAMVAFEEARCMREAAIYAGYLGSHDGGGSQRRYRPPASHRHRPTHSSIELPRMFVFWDLIGTFHLCTPPLVQQ
eukprot:g28407.t1